MRKNLGILCLEMEVMLVREKETDEQEDMHFFCLREATVLSSGGMYGSYSTQDITSNPREQV